MQLGLLFLRVVIVAALPASFALGDEPRTWKDTTGQFSIEARLDRLEGADVFLRKSDGAVIKVPASRLSEADRTYLAEIDADPFRAPRQAAAAALTSPAGGGNFTDNPLVFVKLKSGDKELCHRPGLVARVIADQAYVVCPNMVKELVQGGFRPNPPEIPEDLSVELSSGDPATAIVTAGKFVAYFGNRSELVVAGAAKNLPPPHQPAALGDLTEGTPLTVIQVEVQGTSTNLNSLSRHSVQVTSILRSAATLEARPVFSLPSSRRRTIGIALDPSGKLAGLVTSAPDAWYGAGVQGQWTVIPAKRLFQFDAPGFSRLRCGPTGTGEGQAGTEYSFQIEVVDPFQRVRAVHLEVKKAYPERGEPDTAKRITLQPGSDNASARAKTYSGKQLFPQVAGSDAAKGEFKVAVTLELIDGTAEVLPARVTSSPAGPRLPN